MITAAQYSFVGTRALRGRRREITLVLGAHWERTLEHTILVFQDSETVHNAKLTVIFRNLYLSSTFRSKDSER